MSEFNKYAMYSQAVYQEAKNGNDLEKVMSMVDDFQELKTVENAKKYLLDKLKVRDAIRNFPLGGNNYMNINEDKYFYIVRFKTEEEDFVFSYKKI